MAVKSVIESVALGLAVWRLSVMIAREDGPADILKTARYYTGAEDDFGIVHYEDASSLQKLQTCPYCLSPWVAAVFLILREISEPIYWFFLLVFYSSGVTALIEDYFGDKL